MMLVVVVQANGGENESYNITYCVEQENTFRWSSHLCAGNEHEVLESYDDDDFSLDLVLTMMVL